MKDYFWQKLDSRGLLPEAKDLIIVNFSEDCGMQDTRMVLIGFLCSVAHNYHFFLYKVLALNHTTSLEICLWYHLIAWHVVELF